MTFLSRVWRGRTEQGSAQTSWAGEENVLVISDIHLGEDILSEGPEHLSGHIRALNRELAEFVRWHREKSTGAGRWHLIINGDMFDFVKVSLRPDAAEVKERWQRELTEPEIKVGLANTADHAVWKLERILEIHRPLVKQLARFLLSGNRVTIIEGNHDAEFYFEAVQATLRRVLVEQAERAHSAGKLPGPFDGEQVGGALQFRGWFQASLGRYHIEHGHQYDEMCSFEYNLAPYDHAESETLATPMSHRPMPHMAELLGDFSTHGLDRLGLLGLMRRIGSLGPKVIFRLTKIYFTVGVGLLARAGPRRRDQLKALAGKHHERLRAMAQTSPYGFETLEVVDGLKATPAEFSTLKMLHVFFMDRVGVGLGVLSALVVALFLDGGAQLWVAAASLLLGASAIAGLSRIKRPEVVDVLRLAAAQIADKTGARYVVFGHSHHPELVDLQKEFGVGAYGERAFYLNSGSWVTREILRGEEGTGMTYVEITSRGAALKRWLGRERGGESLDSTNGDEGEGAQGEGG